MRRLSPLVGVAAFLIVGLAASLTLTTHVLGAATATSPRCANSSLSVLQNLSGANVASVTVSGVPAACAGATLSLTVNNGTSFSSGAAIIPAGGGSITVTLASAVPVTSAEQTDLVIAGP
jgi:hypothetical protein